MQNGIVHAEASQVEHSESGVLPLFGPLFYQLLGPIGLKPAPWSSWLPTADACCFAAATQPGEWRAQRWAPTKIFYIGTAPKSGPESEYLASHN